MILRRLSLLGLFLVPALACRSGGAGARAEAAAIAPAAAAETRITLLHFNDVYEITPMEGGRTGGLARVATLRKQLADSIPVVLTTLGGDFFSPSALGTAEVDGERLAGRQMVAVLNAVGLDWATLGNHEFDIPEAAFRRRLAESRFGYVIGNVTDSAGRRFPGTVPHAIVAIPADGRTIRLGIVGAVLDANRAPWVRYDDPLSSIRAHVAMIRDSVDAIVALTHLSVAQDQRLAEAIPELDVIVGGHEHENYMLRRGPRLTPILKGDANVRTVVVVTLHFSPVRGARPRVTAELFPITDAIPEDPAVRDEVRRWLDRGFAGYRALGFVPDSVVAILASPLDGLESTVRRRAGSLSDVILASMRREVGDAEVAFFNGGSIRIDDVVPPGPVTQYDVIRILPFGGRLVRAEIRGRLLARVFAAGRASVGRGGYLHISGATVDDDGRWRIGGDVVDPERFYRVVTSDFLLSGGESGMDALTRTSPDVRAVADLRDVRMALIDELARGGR